MERRREEGWTALLDFACCQQRRPVRTLVPYATLFRSRLTQHAVSDLDGGCGRRDFRQAASVGRAEGRECRGSQVCATVSVENGQIGRASCRESGHVQGVDKVVKNKGVWLHVRTDGRRGAAG